MSALGALWVVALLVLHAWTGRLNDARSRAPTPRPPGDAAAAALVRRGIELAVWTLTAGFIPAYTALYVARSRSPVASTLVCAAAVIAIAGSIVRIRRLARDMEILRRRRDLQILVGELLDRTLPSEFRTFHDVPVLGDTIDHVVAGPTGVFAIESWPRCRQAPDTDGKPRRVRHDGRKLYFDDRAERGDPRDLNAARRKAHSLKEWITVAAREYVDVSPVLVLAGWQIQTEPGVPAAEKGSVQVLDEVELGALSEGRRILQPCTIHRVTDRLGPHRRTGQPSRACRGWKPDGPASACNAANMC